MIEHEYSTDGVLLRVIDLRRFCDVVEFQLAHFKLMATEEILMFAPEHKQRNAALGILTQSEIQLIKEKINEVVVHYNNCKALVHMVSWDGFKETHAEACNKVQSITWR